jgi:hypothetical protein
MNSDSTDAIDAPAAAQAVLNATASPGLTLIFTWA